MSDWLERELARGLGGVKAPDALGERLGFTRTAQREFRGAVLAVAAGVCLIVAGGYAASRSHALDLYRAPAREAAVQLAANRPVSLVSWNRGALRCDGGAGLNVPLPNANTTALLAHHGQVERTHSTADTGCGFCHSL
ncbi:MAG: hypothetical protein ABI806_08455 [Candidatus Solibacter sp.]